jgi:hypothetical protein
MDSSGKIHDEKDLTEKQKKECVPIPSNELEEVRGMSRKDRRAWYRKNKKDPRVIAHMNEKNNE